MDSKFKNVPITILDFMAILLPGLVWLFLLFLTFQFLLHGQSPIVESPMTVLNGIAAKKDPELPWTPIVLFIVAAALLIGYCLKPIAMRLAEMLAAIFFMRRKKFRTKYFRRLKYPFKHFYKRTECHRKVYSFIRQELQCSPYKLPGHQPFSTAKRYIRLMAPSLWEESERMEAEVRMAGTLFLAAVYSFVLSGTVLIFQYAERIPASYRRNTWTWFVLSAVITFVLAESFNYLRFREVGYTYVNALIASKFKPAITKSESKAGEV